MQREVAGGADHRALILACARGDKGALRALYELEAATMNGVARRILQRRDWAEDAVHDAFVQVWRKAAGFDPAIGSGRGWLYTILRNLCLNMRRDRGREEATDDGHLEALTVKLDTDDVFHRLAEDSTLKRCLEALEAPRRNSIILAYAGGYSHGEIAGQLGVPLGTIKAWIRRGLIALRECLA